MVFIILGQGLQISCHVESFLAQQQTSYLWVRRNTNVKPHARVVSVTGKGVVRERNVRTAFERKTVWCFLKSVLCSNAFAFHINVPGNCTVFDTTTFCVLVS